LWPAPFSAVWHWAHLVRNIFSPALESPGGACSNDAIDWLISPQRKRRLLGYWDWVWKNRSEGKFGVLRVFIGWENGTRSPRYFLECPNFFRWRGSFLALQFCFILCLKKQKSSVSLRQKSSLVGSWLACDFRWILISFYYSYLILHVKGGDHNILLGYLRWVHSSRGMLGLVQTLKIDS
jgi:hypothetical protein